MEYGEREPLAGRLDPVAVSGTARSLFLKKPIDARPPTVHVPCVASEAAAEESTMSKHAKKQNFATIELNERETLLWDSAGPDGEDFRRATRAEARTLNAWHVEILSADGIVLDALDF